MTSRSRTSPVEFTLRSGPLSETARRLTEPQLEDSLLSLAESGVHPQYDPLSKLRDKAGSSLATSAIFHLWIGLLVTIKRECVHKRSELMLLSMKRVGMR